MFASFAIQPRYCKHEGNVSTYQLFSQHLSWPRRHLVDRGTFAKRSETTNVLSELRRMYSPCQKKLHTANCVGRGGRKKVQRSNKSRQKGDSVSHLAVDAHIHVYVCFGYIKQKEENSHNGKCLTLTMDDLTALSKLTMYNAGKQFM